MGARDSAAQPRRKQRIAWLWSVIPSLWTLLWTQVPGFATLDYHACLVAAPVVGICAAMLTVQRVSNSSWRAGQAALVTVGPLVILLATALWVPLCDRVTGLQFYVLGPLLSGVVGAAMAATASRLWPRHPRLGFAGLVLITAAAPLWYFYAHPQAFGFHPLVGWIAGPLYEDAVQPGWTYVAFRLTDLGIWLAAANIGRHRLAIWIAATAIAVSMFRAGPDGWLVSTDRLQRHLSVQFESEGMVLHVFRGSKRPDLWAADFAFRRAQLVRFFGSEPTETLHVYIYPDAERKRRWMGAESVELAKPWLRQVHIVAPQYGSTIVTHELAHVVAADFASWPFRVPMRGGIAPDPLLIEGLAVAAQWPIHESMTVHQWAAAMRRLQLAPSVEELISPAAFFSQTGSRSYTIAGSYLRFVRDTFGVQALLQLYRRGETGPWVPRWRQFIDAAAASLTDEQMAMATARFERPAMFYRKCALHTGRRYKLADWQNALGRRHAAMDTLLELHAEVGDVGSGLAAANACVGAEAPRSGRKTLAALRERKQLTTQVQRTAADRLSGDLHWAAGERDAAVRSWLSARKTAVFTSMLRALEVRLGSEYAAELMLKPSKVPWRERSLHAALARPDDAMLAYLAARAWVLSDDRPEAFDMGRIAQRLARMGVAKALVGEAWRLAALEKAHRGDCSHTDAPGWTNDLRERCDFMASRRLVERCEPVQNRFEGFSSAGAEVRCGHWEHDRGQGHSVDIWVGVLPLRERGVVDEQAAASDRVARVLHAVPMRQKQRDRVGISAVHAFFVAHELQPNARVADRAVCHDVARAAKSAGNGEGGKRPEQVNARFAGHKIGSAGAAQRQDAGQRGKLSVRDANHPAFLQLGERGCHLFVIFADGFDCRLDQFFRRAHPTA